MEEVDEVLVAGSGPQFVKNKAARNNKIGG